MKYLSLFASFILLVCLADAARAEWSLDAGADLAYESNLSHSYDRGDRKSDFALSPYLSTARHYQLSEYSRFSLSAQGEADVYSRYDRLNAVSAKITASMKNKPGLGRYVPWITIYGSGGALASNLSLSDSVLADAGFTVGKRLNERLELQAGYEYEHRSARNDLFILNRNLVHADLDFMLTRAAGISAGYALRRGDLVSYYSDDGGELSPGEVSLTTFGSPMTAERLRATTHSFALALSYVLNDNFSARLTLERCLTSADGHSYPDDQIRLGILYSY